MRVHGENHLDLSEGHTRPPRQTTLDSEQAAGRHAPRAPKDDDENPFGAI
jgi:hypothetical protein